VLSADAMPDHVARLNAAGILAYLTKPINVAEVLRLVDRTLV
jgi:CheY-like chemotaxis protein